jgi:hypothetical protein
VARLVWRVKLVTEFGSWETTEVEVARIERDERAGLADLGLRLAEAKRLTAAIQAEIVPAQVTVAGESIQPKSGSWVVAWAPRIGGTCRDAGTGKEHRHSPSG